MFKIRFKSKKGVYPKKNNEGKYLNNKFVICIILLPYERKMCLFVSSNEFLLRLRQRFVLG